MRDRARAVSSALASAAVVIAALVVVVGSPRWGSAAADGPALRLSGGIESLMPGGSADLVITVRNPGTHAVEVSRITARVTGASGGCAASALDITPWAGSLAVPAGGSAVAPLRVSLSAGCEGSSWSLAYASS
ncbi:MAG: hypothetical protein ABR614_10165 [Mycobacteriales bacterium]